MTIQKVLNNYQHVNPGCKNNLARLLMHGGLSGTGKLVILPVDQGFEHGPDQSFAKNPDAYNPEYHVKIAIEAGLSAYAAPIGMLEDVAHKYPGQIPLILKLNSASSLFPKFNQPDQAFISTPEDAIRLGCVGIGLTLYPGSGNYKKMLQEASCIITKAKSYGLVTVAWAYPRGGDLDAQDETSVEVISYAAHMACLLGADIIKVKPPISTKQNCINQQTLTQKIQSVKRSCFDSKRIVLFSGGKNKDAKDLFQEIEQIKNGGADGSIVGRNVFQRPKKEAMELLQKIITIYKS